MDGSRIQQPDSKAAPREYLAYQLCMALASAHEDDADAIVSAWVADRLTIGPQPDVFQTLKSDAKWWAETAPKAELQAYVKEGMQTLGAAALGQSMRKQLLVELWKGLSQQDRAAFIAKVGGSRG